MKRVFRAALPCILLISGVLAPPARAYWIPDGIALCSATGDQTWSQTVPDGAGGAIVVWQDYRGGNWEIYAQRVSAAGHAVWTAQGVVLCSATGDQQSPQLVPDGSGGAVVVWQDYRGGNWDIYVQRVSGSGSVQWTADGVPVCAASGDQQSPQTATDGAGGAIVSWSDYRGTTYDIYAQRVGGAGTIQWTADGVALCAANGIQNFPQLVSDGSGGAIVTWVDRRGATYDIYAQRVSGAGAIQWTANGVALCTAPMNQMNPGIASDGAGGAIVAWYDFRWIDDTDIYAQRVSGSGSVQWTANGVGLCVVSGNQLDPAIISDGSGGAIACWQDSRGASIDVYAQHVNASGAVQWLSNGFAVCDTAGSQVNPALVPDGDGGAIISWQDGRSGASDIYAQRMDALGVERWSEDGVALCAAAADQQRPAVASDGLEGAIVAWWDYRGADCDIYAQSIDYEGRVAFLVPVITSVLDVPGDQGGSVRITIARSRLDDALETEYQISAYNVWERLEDRALLTGDSRRSYGEESFPPGDWELIGCFDGSQQGSYTFRSRTLADSTADGIYYSHYVVSAHTTKPSVWFLSDPDSGYSVDNVPPQPPTGLAAERRLDPEGLALSWYASAESDLSHYAVYRGAAEGFAPGTENLVATPYDPEWFDGSWRSPSVYFYKIAAVDRHGNESAFTLVRPGDVTGEETPQGPLADYLDRNYPNPFNPTTTILFGLEQPTDVSIRIYDASGALVRILIEARRGAGNFQESWDGLDDRGRAVSSGIYYCRLRAGAFSRTIKLVLVR